jgi:hypothetical protein
VPNAHPSESEVLASVLLALGSRTDVRVFRANTGMARYGDMVVRYGVPGQADITGILPDGRRLEIECKTLVGRLSKQQQAFQRMIERFNGLYLVARSAADALSQLQAAGYCLDG